LSDMRLYGVVSHDIDEVIEFFLTRSAAEEVASSWDSDEPDAAGQLAVVTFELDVSSN
jgi:hypothetical protein